MTKRYSNKYIAVIVALCIFSLGSCKQKGSKEKVVEEGASYDNLKQALTFYASFDKGINADYALGDSLMYTVPNRSALDSAMAGLHKSDIARLEGKGKYGSGLHFAKRSKGSIYYASAKNIAYQNKNWNGAISFWLSLDPATDLEPGYCDPIQITDVSYNDAAIWVDFTKDNPRDFRLGVIGDRDIWNPDGLEDEDNLFLPQLVPVSNPPFTTNNWTHVLINFSGLNTENGETSLYLNGELKGSRTNITDSFTWELDKSNIYLGLSYIGLMDDLSIFNRNLTEKEIKQLYAMEGGVKVILE
ncbi:LamG-like jellyroll fold domain-containing protein [Flagellimonas flava]|uniref:Concanavalin A-like lectin/glucanases superfamily protein n=1 Tax=Flagellimonas flava TaxID=570519 RepID=A0A1M5JZV9_9FLAO|nr:LamG-like jellyroll fold domain-containing protein [Allomuricauda flava]SHG45809.1 Concanavalin A-like lectin/glucanases superfamily protein [Allomuricauda flava]